MNWTLISLSGSLLSCFFFLAFATSELQKDKGMSAFIAVVFATIMAMNILSILDVI